MFNSINDKKSATDRQNTVKLMQFASGAAIAFLGVCKLLIFVSKLSLSINESISIEAGNKKYSQGQYQAAIVEYNKAIDSNPSSAEAYTNRCIAKDNLGKSQEALADCNKAIELDPQNNIAYSNRSNIKLNLGQNQEAVTDGDKSIALNPKMAEAYFNRALAKLNLQQQTSAVEDLRQAAELFEQDGNTEKYQMVLKLIQEVENSK